MQIITEKDWSKTEIHQKKEWPPELIVLLRILEFSASPKLLLWGNSFLSFFNQSFADIMPEDFDEKAIGEPFPDVLPQVWAQIGRQSKEAMCSNGRIESDIACFLPGANSTEVNCFEFNYSPVLDDKRENLGILIDVCEIASPNSIEFAIMCGNSYLRSLLLYAPFFIALVRGPELRIEFVNHAASEMFPGRKLNGNSFTEAIPEAIEYKLLDLLNNVFRDGQPTRALDSRFCIANGTEETEKLHFINFSLYPIFDSTGDVSSVLIMADDVTQRNLAKQESDRRQHKRIHELRVDAMGTMALTLAHELNQPLAAVSNYVAAALRSIGGAQYELADLLEQALEEVTRAGNVIRHARSLVRLGIAERTCVSIRKACERTVGLFEAADGPSLWVTLNLAPDAAYVFIDEVQFEQVLLNILRNSAEASKNSQKKELVLTTEPAEGGRVRLIFRDFGSGFSDDALVTWLTPPLRHKTSNGLGVGLALSRTILEANRGAINVFNAHNEGAFVVIELARTIHEASVADLFGGDQLMAR